MHVPNLFNAPRFDDVPMFANTQINKENKQEFISKRIAKVKVHVHTMTMRPKEETCKSWCNNPLWHKHLTNNMRFIEKCVKLGLNMKRDLPFDAFYVCLTYLDRKRHLD
jgi:hypothetical protein